MNTQEGNNQYLDDKIDEPQRNELGRAADDNIIFVNPFRHIPGPAGEISISDDYMKNKEVYQQKITQIQRNNDASKSLINKSVKEKRQQEEFERNLAATLENVFEKLKIQNGAQLCKQYNIEYMKTGNNYEKKVKLAALTVKNILRYDSVQSANVLLANFYKTNPFSCTNTPNMGSKDDMIEATIHKAVIDKYPHILTPGTLMLLKNFCIFHPSPRTFHLIITLNNILNILTSSAVQKKIEKHHSSQKNQRRLSHAKNKEQTAQEEMSAGAIGLRAEFPPFESTQTEDSMEEQPDFFKEFRDANKGIHDGISNNNFSKQHTSATMADEVIKKRTCSITEISNLQPDANEHNTEIGDSMASQVLISDDLFEMENVQVQKKSRLQSDTYSANRTHADIDNVLSEPALQDNQLKGLEDATNVQQINQKPPPPEEDFDLFKDTYNAEEEHNTLGNDIDNLDIQELQNEDEFF